MQLSEYLHQGDWFQKLAREQQQLIELGIQLHRRELDDQQQNKRQLIDYSFLLFPLSKAYEGFLKSYLKNQQLLPHSVYQGRRFRIGRALNPDISTKYRDEYWLYDEVERIIGQELSRQMWNTWLECRNQIFHYFPKHTLFLNLNQTTQKMELVLRTIQNMIKKTYIE